MGRHSRSTERGRCSLSRACRAPSSGIKLLGFKDRSELTFEDNVKHSYFIYPDEMVRAPAMP